MNLENHSAYWLFLTRKGYKNLNHENIIIGPGSKELMFLLQVAFDGEVILPVPSWVSYAPQAIIDEK